MGTTERPADMAPLTGQVGEEAKSEQDWTDFSRRWFKNMAVETALGTQTLMNTWVAANTRPKAVATALAGGPWRVLTGESRLKRHRRATVKRRRLRLMH